MLGFPASVSGKKRKGCIITRCWFPPRRYSVARIGWHPWTKASKVWHRFARRKRIISSQPLKEWWLPEAGFIRAHILDQRRAEKELDISVILAANHAGLAPDEKLRATLGKLDDLFGALYPINRGRAAPAIGRYGQDGYYGGGAWYAATLAAAEFCYRDGDLPRGDAYMETVRAFTPESGDLSEQFDRTTGAQTSARHLAWSYAAFLTAVSARRAASA